MDIKATSEEINSLYQLKNGKIPYSLIKELISFCEYHHLESASFSQLFINTVRKQKEPFILAPFKDNMIASMRKASNIHSHFMFSLKALKETGLQVHLELYKPTGKFAYSGIASLGDSLPHKDDFYSNVKLKQEIVVPSAVPFYTLVVRDTYENENDPNFSLFSGRLIPAEQ